MVFTRHCCKAHVKIMVENSMGEKLWLYFSLICFCFYWLVKVSLHICTKKKKPSMDGLFLLNLLNMQIKRVIVKVKVI